jgi:hypothetical protein
MTAKITTDHNSAFFEWACDDERDGFIFRVLQAMDGDLHLSVVPSKTHPHIMEFSRCFSASVRISRCFSASVRIRLPMIGGGSHEHLADGLLAAIAAEREAQNPPQTRKFPNAGPGEVAEHGEFNVVCDHGSWEHINESEGEKGNRAHTVIRMQESRIAFRIPGWCTQRGINDIVRAVCDGQMRT